jgi:DNA mismatch repair ATPase MutS
MASSGKWTVEEMPRFHSILFDREPGAVGGPDEPSFLVDLNLDQVREAMLSGREEYDLAPLFHAPLRDPAAVRYRHEVFRDLASSATRSPIEAFAKRTRSMRGLLVRRTKAHYKLHQRRLLLEAIDAYCEAVLSLTEELADSELESRGLRGLLQYLRDYRESAAFVSLLRETRGLLDALGEIRYSLHIKDARVQVGRYEGEPDYSATVAEAFAKFNEDAAVPAIAKLPIWPEMNHVEARVVDLVARLHTDVFTSLDDYCSRHRRFADDTIGRFDREVQFCLAWLEYIAPLEEAGLELCFPEVSARTTEVSAERAFDLALAAKLVPEGSEVVRNDVTLSAPERIAVVTGPNQGGKTTFARMFGQLHHLASLGLPVPGARVRLALPDRLFTHFEREEDLATLRGKLDDELIRIHGILAEATSESVLVMNESFASTTVADALFLGTELIGQISDLGALCVYVTFVDELSMLGESTVSMVATVASDNPAERTFKLIRRPADGRAYASAIADKYGLGYESLRKRVAR